MAKATGIVFNSNFLNEIKEADKAIIAFENRSDESAKKVIDTFRRIAEKGVVPMVDSLKKESEAWASVLATIGNNPAFKNMRDEAEKALDSTNALLKTLQKTKLYKEGTSTASISNSAMKYANSIMSPRGQKTVENMNLAIRQMVDAQSKLNLNTKTGRDKYEKLENKIKDVKAALDQAKGSTDKIKEETNKLAEVAEFVGKKLAAIFSVQAIVGYANKIIEVRGEFELQHKAMQTLIQDNIESNKLWEQTVQLAVKSPFRVRDLVTYTKQLAAYRVETTKLYDKTKMLADISAGLGVDMNRLILAYGQVKAANFLRGTELRQFSEAGINILKELAEYYSEVEGRVVRVNEVFERVSKRMVSFNDVDTVLQRVTSVGGVFYQMQEKQSETLKGQLMNLKDSLDIALDDVGRKNEQLIKGVISGIKVVVDNWEQTLNISKVLLAAFGLHQIALMSVSRKYIRMAGAVRIVNAEQTKQLTITNLLDLAYKKLGKTMKTSFASGGKALKGLLISTQGLYTFLIGGLVYALFKVAKTANEYRKEIEEINKASLEVKKNVQSISLSFNAKVEHNDIDAARAEFSRLQAMASKEFNLEYNFIPKDMPLEQLTTAFEEIKNDVEKSRDFARQFAVAMQEASQWKITDNLIEDMEQLGGVAQRTELSLLQQIPSIVDYFNTNKDAYEKLTDVQKKAFDELRYNFEKKPDESQLEYIKRLNDAFTILQQNSIQYKWWKNTGILLGPGGSPFEETYAGLDWGDTRTKSGQFNTAWKDAAKKYQEFQKGFTLDETQYETAEERLNAVKSGIDNFVETKKLSDFTRQFMYMMEGIKESSKGIEEDSLFADNGEAERILNDKIRLIRELRKEYLELLKTFGAEESKQKVTNSFADALAEAGLNINDIDFTTEQGVIAALRTLEPEARMAGKKAQIALKDSIGQVEVEIAVKDTKKAQKDIIDDIERMFGNYEVSLEMEKLNIPPDLAKRLFGVEEVTLDELKKEVETKLATARATEGEEDLVKELEGKLKRINELENKALKDRMKEYVKYLRKEQDERIKIKLEEFRKLNELNKTTGLTEEERASISQNIRNESREKMSKAEWDAFSKTPQIVQMFDDLGLISNKALSGLHSDLIRLKDELHNAGLPASELKDILKKIADVENEMQSRNPFKGWSGGFSNIFGGLAASRANYDSKLEAQRQAESAENSWRKALNDFIDKYGEFGGNKAERNRLTWMLTAAVKKTKELREDTKRAREEYDKAVKSVNNLTNGIQTTVDIVTQLTNSILDAVDSFGLLTDEQAAVAGGGLNILGDVAGLAGAAGRIAAGDYIGGITAAISSTASLISHVNETSDAVKDIEIAEQAKQVEKLEKKYEKLAKAIEDAYDVNTLRANNEAMEQNIDAQIKAIEAQRAAEESKKKTDSNAIEEYTSQIEELEQKKAEMQKEFVETLGGTYDYVSVAEDFLDAWLTAFKETGEGLSGLDKSFDEFWKSVLKKQIIYGGATSLVEGYISEINERLKDGVIDTNDESILNKLEEETKEKLNRFFEWANSKYDLTTLDSGELSGLSAGISGITEDQADVLAGYWNAVRFSVASIDNKMDAIINLQKGSDDSNPMIPILKQQLSVSIAIRDMFNSVIGSGNSSTHNGSYLKVLI